VTIVVFFLFFRTFQFFHLIILHYLILFSLSFSNIDMMIRDVFTLQTTLPKSLNGKIHEDLRAPDHPVPVPLVRIESISRRFICSSTIHSFSPPSFDIFFILFNFLLIASPLPPSNPELDHSGQYLCKISLFPSYFSHLLISFSFFIFFFLSAVPGGPPSSAPPSQY
jgi:hypothetical protein